MEASKRMKKELKEQFIISGLFPLYCKQLLFEVDLFDTKLSTISESDFLISVDNYEKQIYLENNKESSIEYTMYKKNKLGFSIKNKPFHDGEKFVSIGMYKKRNLPRLAIADKLSVDSGTEFFVETNYIKKDISAEIIDDTSNVIEHSYTISENIKDVVSLISPIHDRNVHLAVWVYNPAGFRPIVIMKNVSNLLDTFYKKKYDFEKNFMAAPFIDEIVEDRYLYNSALSPVNLTKLELTNYKGTPFVKPDYYLNYYDDKKEK